MVARLIERDYQLILPTLILERTPLVVQVLFFGALISAILSTAGGALLAPAVTLAENVIRPVLKPRDDRAVLRMMRLHGCGARGGGARDGARLEAVHLPAGERVGQGGPRVLVRAARRRALLEAGERARRASFNRRGACHLDRHSRPSPPKRRCRRPWRGSSRGSWAWWPDPSGCPGSRASGVSPRLFRISSLSPFGRGSRCLKCGPCSTRTPTKGKQMNAYKFSGCPATPPSPAS